MVTYGPRCTVHDDRTGARKSGPNRLFVLHTSEGSEGLNSAEALCAYMGMKGDRPNDRGGFYGSSYQYVTDTDRVLPATPEDVVSYSAAGANHDGIHIVFPGAARQTREQWLDAISREYVRQCAAVLVDRSAATGIPLHRLTPGDVVAGKHGLCDHYTITLAYHKTDHTDVGPAFPWDVLFSDIEALQAPPAPPDPLPEDDDMAELLEFAAGDVDPPAWGPTLVVRGTGPARRVNPGELPRLRAQLGEPRRLEPGTPDHDWVRREVLAYDRYVS